MTLQTENDTKTTPHRSPPDLRVGSADSMGHLPDGTVGLVVTSPPYWNARQYATYTKGTASYKDRDYDKGFGSYEEYLALMTRCFTECFRVCKPGGVCCVVVSGVLYNRQQFPIPADLSRRLRDIGWISAEELVWDKTHSACDRFGSFAMRPYPHYFYPNLCSERVLIFRKPGPKLHKSVSENRLNASRVPLSALVKSEISGDVWHIASIRHGQVDHPAAFPQELAHRLIRLYSHSGDLVLDPFLGSGQTMVVAMALGRRFAGVDLEQKFVDYARSRIGEPMRLRDKQLIPRFERVENDPFTQAGPASLDTASGSPDRIDPLRE